MKKNNRIKNSIAKRTNANNASIDTKDGEIDQYLRSARKVVFDFSASKSFSSCSIGQFDNYLKDAENFVEKFREILKNVNKLSMQTISILYDSNNYRHCHKIEDSEDIIVRRVIEKLYEDRDYVRQNYDGEQLYQAGFEKGVRLIGTIKGNVFSVIFVDYFHDLYPCDNKNVRSNKAYSYSV